MARVTKKTNFWNCKLYAKKYGTYYLVIDTLGYGMNVATKPDGTTRNERVFYPFKRTSGRWYINAVFTDYGRWKLFQNWLFGYIVRATDPHQTVMQPMVVSVESEDFEKTGYPTSSIDFGDQWDYTSYSTNISFASASDPETMSGNSSLFHAASHDDISRDFYPAGFQSNSLPAPVPNPLNDNPDDVYDTSASNRGVLGGPTPVPD